MTLLITKGEDWNVAATPDLYFHASSRFFILSGLIWVKVEKRWLVRFLPYEGHCSSKPNLNEGSLGNYILSKDNESSDTEFIEAQPAIMRKKRLKTASLIVFNVYPSKWLRESAELIKYFIHDAYNWYLISSHYFYTKYK